MTALAANANRRYDAPPRVTRSYPVDGGSHIYKGALVCIDANGYAVPASAAAGLIFVGVAQDEANNASGANGDIDVLVDSGMAVRLAASSITQAMVGSDTMLVIDDNTMDETEAVAGIKIGTLVRYESATVGWVAIPDDPARAL